MSSPDVDSLLAVVPAYNESGRIAGVIAGLQRLGLPALVVDDGSRDDTAEQARSAGAIVLSQPNGGKGRALIAGCRWAVEHGYTGVLLLDGDGQHDPAEGPALITAWRNGAHLVIGSRTRCTVQQPAYRKCFNRLSSLLVTFAAGQRILDSQSGFRCCDPRLLLRLPISGCRYDLETEMCVLAARTGHRVVEIPITAIYNDKKSGVHPVFDTYRFFRAIWRSMMASSRGTHHLAAISP
jgi:glycosyltransferase involved in cell wall biosynthesis